MALQLYRVISLKWSAAAMPIHWKTGKFKHKNNSFNPIILVWKKNKAIGLLLYYTNMAWV